MPWSCKRAGYDTKAGYQLRTGHLLLGLHEVLAPWLVVRHRVGFEQGAQLVAQEDGAERLLCEQRCLAALAALLAANARRVRLRSHESGPP